MRLTSNPFLPILMDGRRPDIPRYMKQTSQGENCLPISLEYPGR